MFWVIQSNLYNEYGYTQLMSVIERLEIPHVVVKPVPILNRMLPADFDSFAYKGEINNVPEPFVDDSGLVFVCGAITMSKIAIDRKWKPGSFINENFDFSIWRGHYGENLLNYDAIVCRFDEVKFWWPSFFIRPCEDTKSFAGRVYDSFEEFDKWGVEVLELKNEFSTLSSDTMVSYCSTKVIYREYRFFVVDKVIITGSQYKLGAQVVHSTDIDQDVIDFCQKMVNTWQPARAFVIDIALTPDGCKIVEINNFNSAGFYAADVGKIVNAIENMKF